MAVGNVADGLEIDDIERRVAHRLAEDRLGVCVDQRLDALGAVVVGKAHLDTLPRQDMSEERVGGPVELWRGDDIVVHGGEVQDRVVDRRGARAQDHRSSPAFQCREAPFQHVVRRVVEPVVVEAGNLEIEDGSSMRRVVELMGDRLIDGYRDRSGRVWRVATMDRHRLVMHRTASCVG